MRREILRFTRYGRKIQCLWSHTDLIGIHIKPGVDIPHELLLSQSVGVKNTWNKQRGAKTRSKIFI